MEATRRPSAFPTASELSLSQTDEIRLRRTDSQVVVLPRPVERLPESEKRRRVFIMYFVGFMDLFGVSIMIPLLPNFMQNLGATPSVAGLIGSVYGGLQVFSSPLVGKLSDVYGRKAVLLLCFVGPAIGYLIMGLSGSLLVVVLARIPSGILKHGLSISKAYLADITSVEERRAILGMFNASSSLGFIFGPLLGGYLADQDPTLKLPFLAGAAVFSLNMVIVLIVVPPVHTEVTMATQDENCSVSRDEEVDLADPHPSMLGGVRERKNLSNEYYPDADSESERSKQPSIAVSTSSNNSITLRQLLSHLNLFSGIHLGQIWDLLLIRFLLTFSLIIFRSNLSIFLEEHFGIGYKTLGQVMAFNGVASALASFTCGYVSQLYGSHMTQLLHFSFLLVVSTLAMTLSSSLIPLLFFLALLALATSNIRICMLSLVLKRGREEERGAIIGLSNSMSSFSRMLAPSIVGVAQEYSAEGAGYISVGLGVVGALVLLACHSGEKSRTD